LISSTAGEAIKISRAYILSALVFSIVRAFFLGYIFRDSSLHLHGDVALGGSWFSGTFWFAALFLFLCFVPKPKWVYYLNPISLTLLVWLFYYFGTSSSEAVRGNLKAVVTSSIFDHFGGTLWILVTTWIWHFIVCLDPFEEEAVD
jgi:hypothetical protein